MSDIVKPRMRFSRCQSSATSCVRNSNPKSTRRHTNEGNNRIVPLPRRTTGDQSENRDFTGSWRRPECNKILLVHGLQHMSVNCDHIFNLFCLYGNVTAIKILKDKKVLIELETVEAAKMCKVNLHQLPLDDGIKLNVKYSEHSFIYEPLRLKKLPDGTPAFKVYSTSRLNRFPTARNHLETRRPAAPSKILHFYNAPTDICSIKLHKTLSEAIGTEAIRSVVILPKKQGAKCSTGLIEMRSIDLAAKAISLVNHMAFESTRSRFPFLIKLCFSKWSEIKQTNSLAVLLGATPRKPWWYLHESEQGSNSAKEFQVSLTTHVTSGDHSWTLWCLADDKAKIAATAGPTEASRKQPAGQQHASGSDIVDAMTGPPPSGASDDDRGDAVQCEGLASVVVGEHKRDAVQAVKGAGVRLETLNAYDFSSVSESYLLKRK